MPIIFESPSHEWEEMMKKIQSVPEELIHDHLIKVDVAPCLIDSHLKQGLSIYKIYSMALMEGFQPFPGHEFLEFHYNQ